MRLIDADRFVKENIEELSNAIKNTEVTEEIKECFKAGVEACLLNLEIAYEVDAEPVVRCKDCKRYECCEVFNTFDMDANDFCSKAVKVR